MMRLCSDLIVASMLATDCGRGGIPGGELGSAVIAL